MPESWRDRVGLVQNELLPPDWEVHGIVDPTVVAVWFMKKAGDRVHLVRERERLSDLYRGERRLP